MIQIFLNDLELPINIPNFEKDISGNNEIVSTAGLGDIILSKQKTLATMSFESYFPDSVEKSAQSYVDEINEMRSTKEPISLVITEIDEDLLVLIDDFSYNREHGYYQDIHYEISFTEYKPFGTPQNRVVGEDDNNIFVSPSPPPRSEENRPPVGRTHTVVAGDNLYNISKAKTGSPNNWRQLYELNKAVIGNNPHFILPGQILNIPESWV